MQIDRGAAHAQPAHQWPRRDADAALSPGWLLPGRHTFLLDLEPLSSLPPVARSREPAARPLPLMLPSARSRFARGAAARVERCVTRWDHSCCPLMDEPVALCRSNNRCALACASTNPPMALS